MIIVTGFNSYEAENNVWSYSQTLIIQTFCSGPIFHEY